MIQTTTHFSPPRTEEAIIYSWEQLIQRIDASNDAFNTNSPLLEIPIYYQPLDEIQIKSPSIVIVPCSDSAWVDLLERSPNSLSIVPKTSVIPPGKNLPWDEPTPVLFWGKGYENGENPFAKFNRDGTIVFFADIISATLFMLSRWEETKNPTVDQHGRYLCSESVAYQQGFLDRPIVDEYAHILMLWLEAFLPRWEPQPPTFQIQLSHDIDIVRPYLSRKTGFRQLKKDVFDRQDAKNALKSALHAIWPLVGAKHSPNLQSIRELARLSKQYQIKSTFYFMTADLGEYNRNQYKLTSPWMKQALRNLQEKGFEIGLHAGYFTFDNTELLAVEMERLSQVLGTLHFGGRQHYLRFQVPVTWRQWEKAGLIYDSTLSFAENEGFRCGSCHAYRPFDIEQNRRIEIWERPLIIMDQTLKLYRKFSPDQGKHRILNLAQKCKQVGGTFTLLWHNTSFHGEWEPWVKIYREVLKNLADMRSK